MNEVTVQTNALENVNQQTVPADPTPMQLLQMAIQNKDSMVINNMEKLLDMQIRMEDRQSKKDFHQAFMRFKQDLPPIKKTKRVFYETSKGNVDYTHAELDKMIDQARPIMEKHGFTLRWESRQVERGVAIKCIMTHIGGHSESCEMIAPADASGGKNNVQAVGSTSTYLQRYTVLTLWGVVAETDTDGITPTSIEQRKADLIDLIEDNMKEYKSTFQGTAEEMLSNIWVALGRSKKEKISSHGRLDFLESGIKNKTINWNNGDIS